jgi:excisionase family DNA binding protein
MLRSVREKMASHQTWLRAIRPQRLVGAHAMSHDPQTSQRDSLTYTVEEAAAVLGISRASGYDGVNNGDIPSIRIGRRILVPKAALARLLEGVPA